MSLIPANEQKGCAPLPGVALKNLPHSILFSLFPFLWRRCGPLVADQGMALKVWRETS